MRWAIDYVKNAVWRVNVRVAMLLVVAAGGGVATWQGMTRLRKTPVGGPVKQVATGAGNLAPSGVQPALASLNDEQVPTSGGAGSVRRLQYGQVTDASPTSSTQPAANPYLPTSGDPAGGYAAAVSSRSAYGAADSAYGQFASQSAAVPSDPSAPVSAPVDAPENPYRSAAAAAPSVDPTANNAASPPASNPPLSRSPYAAAAELAGAAAAAVAGSTTSASAPQPITIPEPTAGYGQAPSAEASNSRSSAADLSPAAPPATLPSYSAASQPVPSLAPNTLPVADLSSSPYAAANVPATVGPPAVSPYQTSGPAAGIAPASGGAKPAAAPTPGERQLEGPQQPALAVEKVSPAEIQIGKPATFELYVRNQGQAAARNVVVTDHVPAGTQLQAAKPQPQQGADGSLIWNLGTLQPGEETQISLQIIPQAEGEIGSTAHVTFAAAATSRSICTRPQLAIEHTVPPKILIGESLTVGITVSNPGTGPATGVIIDEDVPDGLSHVAGGQLEYELGTLRPGESKRLELSLRAEKPGIIQNTIRVRGEAGLTASHSAKIEVVAPQLQVGVEGPKVRFLERQATYTVQVANAGTAPARDIELAAYLPRGLKFISTDSQGQYDPGQHAVFWSLAELPPAGLGAAKLTTLPVEPGEQRLKVQASAALNLTAASEQAVQVEQAAELFHSVKDVDEVIEVGSETTYEIRVTNKGSKAATNVRIVAVLPPGLAALSGDGPTRPAGDASQVAFEPLPALRPQEEVVYKVQAKGVQPGDHIVRVQLSSDESRTPVTREESTRVYQDR